MNGTLIKVIIFVGTIMALAGAKYFLHLPDTDPVEKLGMSLIDQEAESIIQDIANDGFVDVDLNS